MNKRLRTILRSYLPRAMWGHLPTRAHLSLLRRGGVARMLAVVPKRRVLYTVVPKAANSTIKHYLAAAYGDVIPSEAAMEAVQIGDALPDPRTVDLRQALAREDWFRFSFVRNPYSRIVSVYKDKILGLGHMDTGQRYAARLGLTAPVPFDAFVRAVCRQSDDEMDHHWCPQSSLLMDEAIRYSHIGRVESFSADMRPVIIRLGLSESSAAELRKSRVNPSRPAPTGGPFAPVLDATLAGLIFARFEVDFSRFGYRADTWREIA